MKILKLEIKNIRGIPAFQIEPKGKSFVIYGPNGSGKSAVIDALDFLLTGKIARLSGEGTEDVSLKDYGPHIDKVSDLSKVEVKAEIQVPGITDNVSIHRKMQKPNELVYEAKYETQLSQILELLNRGQYVFTRREVLKLITSKSSTRAHEFKKLLGRNFINILSDEKADGYAHGQITEDFLKDYVKDPKKNIYVCGPPPMMNAIEKQLANLEIDEKLIIKEVF